MYFTYEYCKAVESVENGLAKLAIFENNYCKIVYPFILRNIKCGDIVSNYFDIVTPYGYGGPCIIGDKNNIKIFRQMFEVYCKKKNIVSEVIRFHPILKNHLLMDECVELKYIRKTVVVDLLNNINVIRSKYSSMNKRNLKKAIKNGVFCVSVEKTSENVNSFIQLYNETMKRNNALDFYYFDKNIITNMLSDNNNTTSHLLFAYFEGKVVSAIIVYICGDIAHYHLGASKTEYLHLKSNNLLFDYMMIFSKTNLAKIIHLGGGYCENDGLFSFKSSFSNNEYLKYFIGTRVFDYEIYSNLVRDISENHILSNSYFPMYRGILKERV